MLCFSIVNIVILKEEKVIKDDFPKNKRSNLRRLYH